MRIYINSPKPILRRCSLPHTIHVWYIYLHVVDLYGFHVGKYPSPMDAMDPLNVGK